MYTGIVAGAFPLVELTQKPGLSQLVVELNEALVAGLTIGASVGLNGACMTVTAIDGVKVHFDAMQETLSLTTLGQLREGDLLNVERSANQGAEIGGHLISGHVDGTAELIALETPENNCTMTFQLPPELVKYVFKKGFIGLHGCSLTVADFDRERRRFSVCLIPETLRVTNLSDLQLGDRVNIEVDRQTQVIVDTVERVLAEREVH
ncbi:riboflavin synthase [Litorivivens lipolytica]|uniref:Riboflavin synthase n=1 Tax=Litorivivens lipolytica TaxID=1524264 RepID=A0A7W4Z6L4_9GAMM|nr:riboflavin synthase subunit alpha [Litorivivens lipolytica]MBB3048332.1 riboflavin synthase [Litorivivens lipolytica]